MAAAQATVTLKHLAASLLDNHDLPKKQAEAVLGDLVVPATRHLKKGAKVRLTDRSRGRGRRLVALETFRRCQRQHHGTLVQLSTSAPLLRSEIYACIDGR